MIPYTIKDISDYILWYCNQKQYYVNAFKLQQILYFLQAEFLVAHATSLFEDKIEAVDWGIKIKPIYDEYKIFGSALIPYIEDSDITLSYFESIIDPKDIEEIDSIIDIVGPYNWQQLREIICKQDPWHFTYYYCKNKEIIRSRIYSFFYEKDRIKLDE